MRLPSQSWSALQPTSQELCLHIVRVLWAFAFLSSFLYTGAQRPHFHSLGHEFLLIQELNKVVSGADNSLGPIFKAFEGMPSVPVAFFIFSESKAARTCPCVTGSISMVWVEFLFSYCILWTQGWSLKSSIDFLSIAVPPMPSAKVATAQPILQPLAVDPLSYCRLFLNGCRFFQYSS